MDLDKITPIELLRLHDQIIDELIRRGIAKTRNQPVSEYAKWFVSERLQLTRLENPSARYDATDKKTGEKFIIKSRHITDNRAIQFGVIRDIQDRNFDMLVAVTFGLDISVTEAYLIPIELLLENLNHNRHQNGYILKLRDLNLNDPRIKNIKTLLI